MLEFRIDCVLVGNPGAVAVQSCCSSCYFLVFRPCHDTMSSKLLNAAECRVVVIAFLQQSLLVLASIRRWRSDSDDHSALMSPNYSTVVLQTTAIDCHCTTTISRPRTRKQSSRLHTSTLQTHMCGATSVCRQSRAVLLLLLRHEDGEQQHVVTMQVCRNSSRHVCIALSDFK